MNGGGSLIEREKIKVIKTLNDSNEQAVQPAMCPP